MRLKAIFLILCSLTIAVLLGGAHALAGDSSPVGLPSSAKKEDVQSYQLAAKDVDIARMQLKAAEQNFLAARAALFQSVSADPRTDEISLKPPYQVSRKAVKK